MANIIDKSLHFGQQNYFFVTQDETDPVYVYVGYQNRKGATLIGRFNKDDSAALYYSAAGVFAVIWAAKATFTYVLPSLLLDPVV
jgi:hypothetical protein